MAKKKNVVPQETKKPGPVCGYKPEIHDSSILDIFSQGGFVEEFCAEHDICEMTYFDWLSKYPTFKEHARRGHYKGYVKWIKMPFTLGEAINMSYWYTIMKNKFGMGKTKIPKVLKSNDKDAEVFKNRHDQCWDLLSQGEITIEQAAKLSSMNMDGLKIEEVTSIEPRLAELEKKFKDKK